MQIESTMARVLSTGRQLGRRYLHPFRPLLVRPWLDQGEIQKALSLLQAQPPKLLLVHSSLSACGFVKGGAPTVINAVRDWIGQATLAMPTHTYCYPDDRGACEVFDAHVTVSKVGAITDAFWRLPGVLRSQHPTHSLACEGVEAEKLIAGHDECDTPCGTGSPYQKLIDGDAAVLMLGVSLDSYTLFHTAEDAADVPYLYDQKTYSLRLRDAEGKVRDFRMRRQDMSVSRRFAETASWLEKRGLLVRHTLGKGELLWIPSAGGVHEAVTSELRNDPWFLVAREVSEKKAQAISSTGRK